MTNIIRVVIGLIISCCACIFLIWDQIGGVAVIVILAIIFTAVNIVPAWRRKGIPTFKLRMCNDGAELLTVFLISASITAAFYIYEAFMMIPYHWGMWLIVAVIAFLVEAVVFWNGIIRVYVTSLQLGIKIRVIGVICGWIPIANIWALCKIIKTVRREVKTETSKQQLNDARRQEQVCRTKYPVLLVHGVFFRDYKFPNYWGRIPEELKNNGAEIYYGNHQSAAAVSVSAVELAERIKEVITDTGCEKVNIIAHSKGGLDCRYALANCGITDYVASLTTINTPHRGCIFADYLLDKIPEKMQQTLASTYNGAMRKLGDHDPDFMAAVRDLTASKCKELEEKMSNGAGIYTQSVGSKLNKATDGKFPLNFSYKLVEYFDGPNDGLVSEGSFEWGEDYTFLTVKGNRGISHGDMIDLNRENIDQFDVREFYVGLVSGLREKGL